MHEYVYKLIFKRFFFFYYTPELLLCLFHIFWYSKMLKFSSGTLERKFWQQVWNFVSYTSAGSVGMRLAGHVSAYVSEHTCGWTLLYSTFGNKWRLVKFPCIPSHVLRGPIQAPVASGRASLGASLLRLVRLPVCKHSIHLWYERLSEKWWLSSEVRAGGCCHLRGQRWDWLREGEIQRASLTW